MTTLWRAVLHNWRIPAVPSESAPVLTKLHARTSQKNKRLYENDCDDGKGWQDCGGNSGMIMLGPRRQIFRRRALLKKKANQKIETSCRSDVTCDNFVTHVRFFFVGDDHRKRVLSDGHERWSNWRTRFRSGDSQMLEYRVAWILCQAPNKRFLGRREVRKNGWSEMTNNSFEKSPTRKDSLGKVKTSLLGLRIWMKYIPGGWIDRFVSLNMMMMTEFAK